MLMPNSCQGLPVNVFIVIYYVFFLTLEFVIMCHPCYEMDYFSFIVLGSGFVSFCTLLVCGLSGVLPTCVDIPGISHLIVNVLPGVSSSDEILLPIVSSELSFNDASIMFCSYLLCLYALY